MKLYKALKKVKSNEYIMILDKEEDVIFTGKKCEFENTHCGNLTSKNWKKTTLDKYGLCKVLETQDNGKTFVIDYLIM